MHQLGSNLKLSQQLVVPGDDVHSAVARWPWLLDVVHHPNYLSGDSKSHAVTSLEQMLQRRHGQPTSGDVPHPRQPQSWLSHEFSLNGVEPFQAPTNFPPGIHIRSQRVKLKGGKFQRGCVCNTKPLGDLKRFRYRIFIEGRSPSRNAQHIASPINTPLGQVHGLLLMLIRPVLLRPKTTLSPTPDIHLAQAGRPTITAHP